MEQYPRFAWPAEPLLSLSPLPPGTITSRPGPGPLFQPCPWCSFTVFPSSSAASSCDQEHQSALEEAKQPKNDNVVIPECAHGGLYKPVQCHPSTGYCWCVLVDTGRPIPGTSTR